MVAQAISMATVGVMAASIYCYHPKVGLPSQRSLSRLATFSQTAPSGGHIHHPVLPRVQIHGHSYWWVHYVGYIINVKDCCMDVRDIV